MLQEREMAQRNIKGRSKCIMEGRTAYIRPLFGAVTYGLSCVKCKVQAKALKLRDLSVWMLNHQAS